MAWLVQGGHTECNVKALANRFLRVTFCPRTRFKRPLAPANTLLPLRQHPFLHPRKRQHGPPTYVKQHSYPHTSPLQFHNTQPTG